MQNSYIEKNRRLVSQTRKIQMTSIDKQGGNSPYQTLKPRDKLQSIPLSSKKVRLFQEKHLKLFSSSKNSTNNLSQSPPPKDKSNGNNSAKNDRAAPSYRINPQRLFAGSAIQTAPNINT